MFSNLYFAPYSILLLLSFLHSIALPFVRKCIGGVHVNSNDGDEEAADVRRIKRQESVSYVLDVVRLVLGAGYLLFISYVDNENLKSSDKTTFYAGLSLLLVSIIMECALKQVESIGIKLSLLLLIIGQTLLVYDALKEDNDTLGESFASLLLAIAIAFLYSCISRIRYVYASVSDALEQPLLLQQQQVQKKTLQYTESPEAQANLLSRLFFNWVNREYYFILPFLFSLLSY